MTAPKIDRLKDVLSVVMPFLMSIPAFVLATGTDNTIIACWVFSTGLLSGANLFRVLAKHGKA